MRLKRVIQRNLCGAPTSASSLLDRVPVRGRGWQGQGAPSWWPLEGRLPPPRGAPLLLVLFSGASIFQTVGTQGLLRAGLGLRVNGRAGAIPADSPREDCRVQPAWEPAGPQETGPGMDRHGCECESVWGCWRESVPGSRPGLGQPPPDSKSLQQGDGARFLRTNGLRPFPASRGDGIADTSMFQNEDEGGVRASGTLVGTLSRAVPGRPPNSVRILSATHTLFFDN